MFADAYEIASRFTRPVIVSSRTEDGAVQSGMAAFVVLNEDGWIATAAHVLGSWLSWRRDQQAHAPADPGRPRFTHHSFWWGWDGINLAEVHVRGHADLAIARLEPFEIGIVSDFPTIKDPATLRPATSLCRLGYPFHQLHTDWDEETGLFLLPDGALPAPLFPVEGMFTRQIRVQGSSGPQFIETSSPGLRGQSGGPVFDADGRVWGIQSRTHHLDLGFSPTARTAAGETVEHQFLNVGLATHPAEMIDLAAEKGVRLQVG